MRLRRKRGIGVAFLPQELRSFGEQWAVIQRFCSGSHRQWMARGGLIQETPPDEFYNLPVVLAYSLLDEVLTGLETHGKYSAPPRAMLKAKMHASRSSLNWQDFNAVDRAREQRNDSHMRGS